MHDFSEIDRNQVLFKRLQDSLKERLQSLRERNDRKMAAEDTATIRGQIAEIKELLSDMEEKTKPSTAQRRNPYE